MLRGFFFLFFFFLSLEQQPALSKTGHLHMQCISFKIITAKAGARRLGDQSGGDTLQGFRNEDAYVKNPLVREILRRARKHANTRSCTHERCPFQPISIGKDSADAIEVSHHEARCTIAQLVFKVQRHTDRMWDSDSSSPTPTRLRPAINIYNPHLGPHKS